jgi:two-component system sensor histidine kinase KdpD
VIHVDNNRDRAEGGHKSLDANLQFAKNLGAHIVRVESWSVADGVAQVVREKRITQVIFGRSADKGWKKYLYLSAAHRFLRESPEVDVHIVTKERD